MVFGDKKSFYGKLFVYMVKKIFAAFSILLSLAVVGLFPSHIDKNTECSQPGMSTQTPQKETQSKLQERVYQVWCGGIF